MAGLLLAVPLAHAQEADGAPAPDAPESQTEQARGADEADQENNEVAPAVIQRDNMITVGPVLDVWNTTPAENPNLPEVPKVEIRVTQNNTFQVAGEDYASVQFVTHMAELASDYGNKIVSLSNALPLPILVKLVPADKAGFESPFVIAPQPNGDVHVSIRWGEETEFSQVCQALMSGYLVRCAIWRFGHDAAARVPDWLELGAGLGLEVNLRPALIDEIAQLSREESPWSLERLFTLKAGEQKNFGEARRQCLWLLRFLENQSLDQERFNRLMAGFLKNLPPYHLLVSAFPDQLDDEQTTELWWIVGYEMAVRSRQAPFFSLEESIRLVRESAFVTAEIDGEDVRVRVDQLYGYRGNKLIAKAALQRVREIKLQLQKVNPVYYNSLLSLGQVYETWMALPPPEAGDAFEPGDKDQAYFDAVDLFAGDYQAAQLLDLEIKRLLNW